MNGPENELARVTTLVDVLEFRAGAASDRTAFHFLQRGETESAALNASQLRAHARRIALRLRELISPGDRALLLFPPGLEFVAAFFGSLYAGVIAVPCYPPKRRRIDTRLQAIAKDAQPAIVLAPADVIEEIKDQQFVALGDRNLKWLAVDIADEGATDRTDADPDHGWTDPGIESDRLAFLQYTSGSTSTPKGVMVSHGNLAATLRDLDLGWRHDPESVLVTWLPIFHDLGLIYGVLMPVYRGVECYMMSPTAFLRRPWLWLNAISRFRGTHSAAPNFAYDLCVDSITPQDRARLDLRSWQCSANGAEPVRETTCRRFCEMFRECGLDENVICPGYGLAESTLKVAARRRGSGRTLLRADGEALVKSRVLPASADSLSIRELIGCGSNEIGTEIAIVDPESRQRCPPGIVGEIWVSGQSVAQGYWNRPEATAEVFQAFTEGDGPFLRTGDLGFVHEGEIFVTGRLKDMIIVRGFNHYPHDLEATTTRAHPALRANAGAGFSVERDGEECLVIIQEVERTHVRKLEVEAIAAAVRAAITEEHQLQLHTLVLAKPGAVPKTSSGKIQRSAAKALYEAGKIDGVIAEWHAPTMPAGTSSADSDDVGESTSGMIGEAVPLRTPDWRELEDWLISFCAGRLGVAQKDLDPNEPLSRYGMDSIAAVDLAEGIGRRLRRQVEPGVAYDYPTIAALTAHFTGTKQGTVSVSAKADGKSIVSPKENIAIIGIGCRFPGAANPAAFWELLKSGGSAVGPMPLNRPSAETFYAIAAESGLGHIVQGGFLDSVDQFDGPFFGIGPREAESLDPQQRLLLEVSWEALEEAGLPPDELTGSRTGIFVGISTNDYGRLLSDRPDEYAGQGNALSVAANRLSYFYDWCGPSVAIDTACSSALVAVHQACASLRVRECNLALAGGVNLILSPHWSVSFARAGMLAPNGKCKTFDAGAEGYVRGEGCGLVLLQRLEDAIGEGRRILAVIRGSAVNQDGRSNGLTAPNSIAQRDVISRALADAGIAPDLVSYVEAHGTGTQLGDPIELQALRDVLFSKRDRELRCWIGSVKTNIGHLEAAAGIAGLIKVVLALVHRAIPAHLNLGQLNPKIPSNDVFPLIPRELQSWPSNGRRIAAVSAFGFGGTNAHAVLEEADIETVSTADVPKTAELRAPVLLALSAKSPESLCEIAAAYRQTFLEKPATSLEAEAIVRAAAVHRAQLVHRAALVAEDREALESGLRGITIASDLAGQNRRTDNQCFLATGHAHRPPRVAFLFTGQGSQYSGMARGIYETEPVFRAALKRCQAILENTLPIPLLDLLHSETHRLALDQTAYTQPALFALECALCELWRSWGVVPHAVLGHSVGEYAAACTAGVFDFETGLRLIAERARLMQTLPANGGMAAVFAPASQVSELIAATASDIDVAAINGPNETVISGRSEEVEATCHRLQAAGTRIQRLQVSHAFHSRLIEPVLPPFAEFLGRHSFSAPAIPFVSNLTGQLESEVFVSPDYWARHTRRAVRFAEGVAALDRLGCEVFVEIGPNALLIGLARRALGQSAATFVASLRRGRSDRRQMSEAVAEIFAAGARISWGNYYQRRTTEHVPLPSYPFQRQRYWLPKSQCPVQAGDKPRLAAAYVLDWRVLSQDPAPGFQDDRNRLNRAFTVVTEEAAGGHALAAALSVCGATVKVTEAKTPFDSVVPVNRGELANEIIYLTSSSVAQNPAEATADRCEKLLRLVQALGELRHPGTLRIVTHGAMSVIAPDEVSDPAQTALWGFGRTIAREHSDFWSGLIDLTQAGSPAEIAQLARLLFYGNPEPECALRESRIRIPRLTTNSPANPEPLQLRPDATYLITGGSGAIGRELLRRCVQRGARHLVVLSRHAREEARLEPIAREIVSLGGSLTIESVDMADRGGVQAMVEQIRRSHPALRGVFHLAGVTDDGLLLGYDAGRLRRVLESKVNGAQILHEETAASALDYFVCFSSAAALFGAVGQAAYSAANAYMDGLVAGRRAKGLTGLSIQWGPWANDGMAARLGHAEQRPWAREGWTELDPSSGLDALERLLVGATQGPVAVFSVDWKEHALRRSHVMPLVGELVAEIGDPIRDPANPSREGGTLFRSELVNLPATERLKRIREHVAFEVRQVLGFPEDHVVDPDQGFNDMGIDSTMAVTLLNRLRTDIDSELPATLAYSYPTVHELAAHLTEVVSQSRNSTEALQANVGTLGARARASLNIPSRSTSLPHPQESAYVNGPAAEFGRVRRPIPEPGLNEPIAVVGMGCRFPGGVSNPEQYWRLLCNGIDAAGPIPENRWPVDAFYDQDRESPGTIYTRFGSFLDDVSGFDADFFRMSPREARSLDPQQRLLLEVTWETLEHAAIPPGPLKNSQTGMFVGIGQNDYAQLQLYSGDLKRISHFDGTGNAFCFAAGRVSHTFGFRGPSIAVDSACSSSLVAVHLACQSLRARECDLALAGGVQLILTPAVMVFLCRTGVLAEDGRCKAFDAAADGFGRGEGCGLVALKRLSDALADGDFIWTVIRGGAVNHCGPSSGLTVPSATAQAELMSRALATAGLLQEAVSYVETHGTGTKLGDSIEIEALTAVYGRNRSPENPLWLASAKTNHGHLEAAAGIAGLIKTALSLHHRKLPPHLHFKNPTPLVPWNSLPFRVPTELIDWVAKEPRIAGVSSFGIGGANAHVLLEEVTHKQVKAAEPRRNLLVLSARTETAVRELVSRYAKHLEIHPALEILDVCRTAALGRNHFPHRIALVVDSLDGAVTALGAVGRGELTANAWIGRVATSKPEIEGSHPIGTLEEVASGYVEGLDIDWSGWFSEPNCRPVVLPGYPFERQRHWLEVPRSFAVPVNNMAPEQAPPPEVDCIYEVTWDQADLTRQKKHASPPIGRWIVTCDECGIGDRIAEQLRKNGQLCIRLLPDRNTEQTAADEWKIALRDPDPFGVILRQLVSTSMGDNFGVVYSLGISDQEALSGPVLQRARAIGCLPALQIFQALRRLEPRVQSRVWLLTSGCQSPGQSFDSNGLLQSMLWGLGRSLAIEWPELWGGLHDLSANPDDTEIERLVAELLYPSLDQVAWRGEDAWIPRLRRGKNATPEARVEFRPDSAYWVTGGWGAIGLRLAKWLAERGAGLIVLSARSEPSSQASAFVGECASQGKQVWLRQSDCADTDATLKMMREIELSGFSLRGVFHAAGLAGFCNSGEIDIAELDRVCRAKVEGAWNLHQATLGHELDHFVLFSSIASVWGSKGQAHYSAANHFLDRLAFLRSTLGLPALAVNWGPWAGDGLAEPGTPQMLEKRGIAGLTPEAALRSLETLMLNGGITEAVVARVDWRRFVPLFDSLPRREFFDQVFGGEMSPTTAGEIQTEPAISSLAAMSETERRQELLRSLGGFVGERLGYQPGRLPSPQTGFFDLGMDSVMAIEFRRRIEQEFGLQMSATLTFDYPNLNRLVDHLEETLFGGPDVPQPDVRLATSVDNKAQIEDEQPLDGLIEERLSQLETLLNSGGRPDRNG